MADISQVVAESLCHGCGACAAACPRRAISFRETTGGYVFPEIDPGSCCHCGRCVAVCPGRHFGRLLRDLTGANPFVGPVISCAVGRAADEAIYQNGQSGGVATALLQHLFTTGQIKAAIVAVMEAGCSPRGAGRIATGMDETMRAQKSKYTPIPLLAELARLQESRDGLALVGLPCHIHGLYNLFELNPALRKKVIFKIGLICDRVMTCAAIDFLAGKATQQAVRGFIFKDKCRSSHPNNLVVIKTNGEPVIAKDSWRTGSKDFFTPARCRICFDKMNAFADVALGDPYGVPGADLIRGETVVLVRTDSGAALIAEAKERGAVLLRGADERQILAGQAMERKRRVWTAYMQAWKNLGKTLPDYPFPFEEAKAAASEEKSLIHALGLDGYPSRGAVLKAAERWLFKREATMALQRPFRLMRSRWRRLFQRGESRA